MMTILLIFLVIVSCLLFKVKQKITGKTPDVGNTKNVEIAVPLKYFANFKLFKCL